MFNQRIEERYIKTWTGEINSQSKLTYYVKFKSNFERELYINLWKIHLEKLCQGFSLVSTINIVESELQFLCICPLYRDLQTKYHIPISFNTILTFSKLMSLILERLAIIVSKYVYFAMLRRTDTTNTVTSTWSYYVYMFVYSTSLANNHVVAVTKAWTYAEMPINSNGLFIIHIFMCLCL